MADVQRLNELQLVPVIELLPSAFSDREFPVGPLSDHRAAWSQHWLDCLEDAGITEIRPIGAGSMHVATNALGDLAALDRVLRKLVEAEALTDPEAISALSGGFALVSNETVLSEPSCCGDLADWAEWRSVADYCEPAWQIVWTGHPWISARADGSDLILSNPHESSEPEPRWVVSRNLIHPAVDTALKNLELFAIRLTMLILDTIRNAAQATQAARTLAGLASLTRKSDGA